MFSKSNIDCTSLYQGLDPWIRNKSEDQDRHLSAWEGGIPFGLEKIVVLKKEKKIIKGEICSENKLVVGVRYWEKNLWGQGRMSREAGDTGRVKFGGVYAF